MKKILLITYQNGFAFLSFIFYNFFWYLHDSFLFLYQNVYVHPSCVQKIMLSLYCVRLYLLRSFFFFLSFFVRCVQNYKHIYLSTSYLLRCNVVFLKSQYIIFNTTNANNISIRIASISVDWHLGWMQFLVLFCKLYINSIFSVPIKFLPMNLHYSSFIYQSSLHWIDMSPWLFFLFHCDPSI